MGGQRMKKSNPVESTTSNLAEESAPEGASLDPKVLETIGRALKAHYDDLVHAPLPDKFLDLLARLEKEEEREEESEGKPDAAG
jgi:Anti-sigma factor NepR